LKSHDIKPVEYEDAYFEDWKIYLYGWWILCL
jgi:hypothetical protein